MNKVLINNQEIYFYNGVYFSKESIDYLRMHLFSESPCFVFLEDLFSKNEKIDCFINNVLKLPALFGKDASTFFSFYSNKINEIPREKALLLLISDLILKKQKTIIVLSEIDYKLLSQSNINFISGFLKIIVSKSGQDSSPKGKRINSLKDSHHETQGTWEGKIGVLLFVFSIAFSFLSGIFAGALAAPQRLNNMAAFIQDIHQNSDSDFEVLQYNVTKAKSWASGKYPVMTDSVLRFEKDFLPTEATAFLSFESTDSEAPISVHEGALGTVNYNFIGIFQRDYLGLTFVVKAERDYWFSNDVSIPQTFADFLLNSSGLPAGAYSELIGTTFEYSTLYGGASSGSKALINSVFSENELYNTYKKIVGRDFLVGSYTAYFPSLPKIDFQVFDFSTKNIRRIYNYIEKFFSIEKDFLLSYAEYTYSVSLLKETENNFIVSEKNAEFQSINSFFKSSSRFVYCAFFALTFVLFLGLSCFFVSRLSKHQRMYPLSFVALISFFTLLTLFISRTDIFYFSSTPIFLNNFYSNLAVLLVFLLTFFVAFFKNPRKGFLLKKIVIQK